MMPDGLEELYGAKSEQEWLTGMKPDLAVLVQATLTARLLTLLCTGERN